MKQLMIIGLSIVVLTLLAPQVAWANTACGGTTYPSSNAVVEHEVIYLTNLERESAGLPPLALNTDLRDIARYHSQDMINDGYAAHESYDVVNGSLVQVCTLWERLETAYVYSAAGENIAGGTYTDTAAEVVASWMASDSHRANILSPNFREIGVGYRYASDSQYTNYWTQDFGTQPFDYPLIIDLEAMETDSTTVDVYIYGVWDEVRLRNDDGSWSSWQPFTNEMTWTLNDVPGERTVTAELLSYSRSTNTVLTADTILLNSAVPLAVDLRQSDAGSAWHMLPLTAIVLLTLLTVLVYASNASAAAIPESAAPSTRAPLKPSPANRMR